MKLTKINDGQLTRTREVPGLLAFQMQYEIKSGKGGLQYTGPKFNRQMWHQVMSFFRWTNKEMDSESQVRLYVNTRLGRWGAWAFPQEARTGMSARELVVKEPPEKAQERFASWESEPSDEWVYFCTAHHHCSASAFQSGTDEEDEKNQDGLHITVGRMDAERHDLHARFYLDGNCFDPDLSLFWPVEPELMERVPALMLDAVARFQMCEKVTVDFPDAWRKNVIEVKREARKADLSGYHLDWDQPTIPSWIRADHALKEIARQCELTGSADEEEFLATIENLCANSLEGIVVQACLEHAVLPEDLLAELRQHPMP
jgi:hypothetical protein